MYGFPVTGEAARWGLDAGLEMGVPVGADDRAKGLVVHITSLIENRYEHALTNRLRGFGYAAAYIESDSFLHGPRQFEARVRSFEQEAMREALFEARRQSGPPTKDKDEPLSGYADRVKAEIRAVFDETRKALPNIENGFQVGPDTDVCGLGHYIAKAVDQKIAEHAYGAVALVRAADALNPHLANRPVIVIGYSAGSFAAPAIVARIRAEFPERQVLLILVGGGGDLLTVARGSNLGSDLLRLESRDGPPPTQEQLDELQAVYLANTTLDPLAMAPIIRSVPVLHVYASKDTVVPTSAAEAFNAAHGSVDRLVHRGNHDTLFYFMGQHAGRIRSWLRTHGVE